MVDLVARTLHIDRRSLSNVSFQKIGITRKKALVTAPMYRDRAALFTAAKTVKPRNFFVNECLIESREQLLYEARKLKKEKNKSFRVYSYGGEIYYRKDQNSDPILLKSITQLDPL